MTTRAEKAVQTGNLILNAAMSRFGTVDFDAVTLAAIADDAGVTVQTVIRRFGGKEGLFAALVQREGPRIEAEREPPSGKDASLEEAIHTLVEHYENDGRAVLNFLKQEARSDPLAEVANSGRDVHERWVRMYCKCVFEGSRGVRRKRLLAAAIAATDLYTWKLLYLDRGMSRAEVEATMLLLLRGLAGEKGER
jgi:AcrR family transcriptional regulator